MESQPDFTNNYSWDQTEEEKRYSPSSLSPLTSEDPIDFSEETIFLDKNMFFSQTENPLDFDPNAPFPFAPPLQVYTGQPQVPQFVSNSSEASHEANNSGSFIPQPMMNHYQSLDNNNNLCSSPFLSSSPSSSSMSSSPTLQQFVNSHLQKKPADAPKKKKVAPKTPEPELVTDPSQPEKKKRGRKKRAKLEITESDVSSVALPRDKLLVLSSNELDNLTEQFKSERALTPQETEELRRQRRLIKNRESAAQSRQRKKDLMEKLQHENELLKQENMNLKSQVSQLQQENYNLRATQNFGLGKNYSHTQPEPAQLSSSAPKKTGITLLIFLFSFALLFMAPFQTRSAPAFPKVVREPMPDVTLNSLKASLNFPNDFSYERIPDMSSKNTEGFIIPERDEEEDEELGADQRQKDKQFLESLKRNPTLKKSQSYLNQPQHSWKQIQTPDQQNYQYQQPEYHYQKLQNQYQYQQLQQQEHQLKQQENYSQQFRQQENQYQTQENYPQQFSQEESQYQQFQQQDDYQIFQQEYQTQENYPQQFSQEESQYQQYQQQEKYKLIEDQPVLVGTTVQKAKPNTPQKEILPPNDEFLKAYQSQDSELFYSSYPTTMDLEVRIPEETLSKTDDCSYCQ